MMTGLPPLLPAGPFQIAYATNDIERACEILAKACGIRAFRRLEGQRPAGGTMRVELAWVGPVMYELVTGEGPGTALFMDRVPQGDFAMMLHHVGHLVDGEAGWQALEERAAATGRPLIGISHNPGFMRSCFVDVPELGHYHEFILPEPAAVEFFNTVPRH
jgi:hypothetical protein